MSLRTTSQFQDIFCTTFNIFENSYTTRLKVKLEILNYDTKVICQYYKLYNFLLAHSLSKKKSSFTHIDVIKGVMIHQKSNLYATCHMGQNDMFVYEKFSMPFWHITRPSYMTLKLLVRIFFVSKNSF